MKICNLAIAIAIILSSCTTGQVASIVNTAAVGYTDYVKASTGTLTPTDVVTATNLAYNDLSGIAALAQAYVGSGKTPAQAALQTGASIPAIGAQVVAALPNVPISQTTASNLFAAAQKIAAQMPTATGPKGLKGRIWREDGWE